MEHFFFKSDRRLQGVQCHRKEYNMNENRLRAYLKVEMAALFTTDPHTGFTEELRANS